MNYDQWKLMSDRDEMDYPNEELDRDYYTSELEHLGCTEVNVDVDNDNETIDFGFEYDGVYYYVVELCPRAFEDMTLKDIIDEADESESACCGAKYDIDHRRCFHCHEAF